MPNRNQRREFPSNKEDAGPMKSGNQHVQIIGQIQSQIEVKYNTKDGTLGNPPRSQQCQLEELESNTPGNCRLCRAVGEEGQREKERR